MSDIRVETAAKWPQLTIGRHPAPFKASFSATINKLDMELRAVGAQAVVVQLAVPRDQLHTNALRSALRPEHPGVILSFTSSRIGKVRFTCDRFMHWHSNLRAIALGMDSLRRVDRYGITSDGQQYAGFRAIEAAETARAFQSPEEAARFIVATALNGEGDDAKIDRVSDVLLDDEELVDTYYRRAAKVAHPDAGGDERTMARLSAARALLDEHR